MANVSLVVLKLVDCPTTLPHISIWVFGILPKEADVLDNSALLYHTWDLIFLMMSNIPHVVVKGVNIQAKQ